MNVVTLLVPVAVLLGGIAPMVWAPAKYEVRYAYIGYTGLAESDECGIKANAQGYDSLVGSVSGIESDGRSDDDVVYVGQLTRVTKIDFCQTRGKRSADDDEQVWCLATLTGRATMVVEITVYGDEGRGAWIKAEPDSTRVATVTVEGDCNPMDMQELKQGYPSGESGGSPSGQGIAEPATPGFVVGGVPRLRVGSYPPEEGGWGLQVVRALPCKRVARSKAEAIRRAEGPCE